MNESLRKLFSPSREEVWRQLADQVNASIVDRGFWQGDCVEARMGEWTVTLDTYVVSSGRTSTTYTRIRAPYVNADGLRFQIYRRGFFSDVAKKLGGQDIEIGDVEFDRDFIIKGNNPAKVQFLFANPNLRALIQAQPAIRLEVRDDEGWFGAKFPEKVDELRFTVVGVIRDVERLKSLFDLFSATLQQLCHIGSAYEDDPQVDLS
jgi:hypothetical protein